MPQSKQPPRETLTAPPLSPRAISAFRRDVYRHYHAHPRPMPWRETCDPYAILVSEIMLQQTQVLRVQRKYAEFLTAFPTVQALAAASLPDVLTVWQGLGYNRRALAVKRCAEEIVASHDGVFPRSIARMEALPGIGHYTARAVAAFAFGIAEPLIETNIRTVFIHYFFQGHESVSDKALMPLISATLDHTDPRNWYYALMDYGAMLKQKHPNPNRRSSHHVRQSRFEGSRRQLRSNILKSVLAAPGINSADLAKNLLRPAGELEEILAELEKEGFLENQAGRFTIRTETQKG